MDDDYQEQTRRLRNSVNCLSLAIRLLQELGEDQERAETLAIIERQAEEAEDAAAALEAAAA